MPQQLAHPSRQKRRRPDPDLRGRTRLLSGVGPGRRAAGRRGAACTSQKTLLSLQAFWNKKIRSVSGPDFLYRMFRVSVYAFLAMSHRAVKATASLMAISESILRLIWMPATFRPCIKVE